jgi:hypothetical protein
VIVDERFSMFLVHPVLYHSKFILVYDLPTLEVWHLLLEDFVISDHPNPPNRCNDNFHRKRHIKIARDVTESIHC